MSIEELESAKSICVNCLYAVQAAILLIPLVMDKLYDKHRPGNIFQKFSNWTLPLVIIAGIGIWLTIKIDGLDSKIGVEHENQLRKERKQSDSTNTANIEKQGLKTVELLAKYGLKVDSTRMEIIKRMEDSTFRRKETVTINAPDPYLFIETVDVFKDTLNSLIVQPNFKSAESTSYNIHAILDIYEISTAKKLSVIARNHESMLNGSALSPSQTTSPYVVLPKNSFTDTYLFRLKANYTKGKKDALKINTDEYYYFTPSLKKNAFGKIKGDLLKNLKDFIRKDSLKSIKKRVR